MDSRTVLHRITFDCGGVYAAGYERHVLSDGHPRERVQSEGALCRNSDSQSSDIAELGKQLRAKFPSIIWEEGSGACDLTLVVSSLLCHCHGIKDSI